MLTKDQRATTDDVVRAVKRNELILLECRRKADGKIVGVLCRMHAESNGIHIEPLAEVIDGDGTMLYDPPKSDCDGDDFDESPIIVGGGFTAQA
jgi:hypothetical protein